MKRSSWWRVAVGLCFAAALVPRVGRAEQPRYIVKQVLATNSFAFLPLYVAMHSDFFREEGVDLQTINVSSTSSGMAAVINGGAQFYVSTPATAARAVSQGADVKMFAAVMDQYASNIVVARSVAEKAGLTPATPVGERVALLKGLRLAGHSPGSSPDLLLRFIARHEGWNPDRDLTILPIAGENILAALDRQRIDGFAYSSPLSDTAVLKHGGVYLLNLAAGEYRPLRGFVSIGLLGNGTWLKTEPDAAAAVVRALWRGMILLQRDPATAMKRVRAQFPKTEEAIYDKSFATNRTAFPDNPTVTRAAMVRNLQFQSEVAGRPISVDVDKTFTNDIVERAAKTLQR